MKCIIINDYVVQPFLLTYGKNACDMLIYCFINCDIVKSIFSIVYSLELLYSIQKRPERDEYTDCLISEIHVWAICVALNITFQL